MEALVGAAAIVGEVEAAAREARWELVATVAASFPTWRSFAGLLQGGGRDIQGQVLVEVSPCLRDGSAISTCGGRGETQLLVSDYR